MKRFYAIKVGGTLASGYLVRFVTEMHDGQIFAHFDVYDPSVEDSLEEHEPFYKPDDILTFKFLCDAASLIHSIKCLTSEFTDPSSDTSNPSDRDPMYHFEVVEVLFM